MQRRLLVLALVAGCGGTAGPFEDARSSIIGGARDTGDPAVVALFAHSPTNPEAGELCTATVVSPTVLLTAAHCVLALEVGRGAVFEVYTSTDLGPTSRGLAVRELHADALFDPARPENGHDIGVVILAAPSSIAPVPINLDPMPPAMNGARVRIVGYGLSDPTTGSGAGTKRQVTTYVDAFDSRLIRIGNSQAQTCNGDSGGPALAMIGGVETIIGVTSFGNEGCTGGGYHTRVDAYATFIRTYVPEPCQPECTGRSCGDDGCGGSCGSCSGDASCSSEGLCVAPEPEPPPPPPTTPPPTPPATTPPATTPPATTPPATTPPASSGTPPADGPPSSGTGPSAAATAILEPGAEAEPLHEAPTGIVGGGCTCVASTRLEARAALLALLAPALALLRSRRRPRST